MSTLEKQNTYALLTKQIEALIENQTQTIGILANVASALHHAFDTFFWTGFYLLDGDVLHLAPFQGTPACYTIPVGKGVCGTAVAENRTLIVDDVASFPGHIACSSLSRSEIVVPFHDDSGNIVGVLDIDSEINASFDRTDAEWLAKIMSMVARQVFP